MNGNSGISDFQSSASPQSPGRSHTRRRGNSLAVPEPSSSGQRGANVEEDFNEDHFGPEQNNTGEEGSSAIGSAYDILSVFRMLSSLITRRVIQNLIQAPQESPTESIHALLRRLANRLQREPFVAPTRSLVALCGLSYFLR